MRPRPNVLAPTSRFLILAVCLFQTVLGRRRLPNEVGHNATDFGRHLVGQNVHVPEPTSPDDHLVTSLPLLDPGKFTTNQWAGLLPASADGDKYLFYWLFAPPPNEKADEEIPLLIWLNGGPACSSMDGLWLENGPFRLKNNGGNWQIDIDDFSWHNTPAYVLYIDQPVGTGIAFTTSNKYPRNDEEVNIDFYYFLKEFMLLHADKFLDESKSTMSRKLYFSGESHAGHYIPSMMNYIRKQNDLSPTITMPLAGAAIGNGWIDPTVQYSAHEAAYGYSLIGRAQERALREEEQKCQAELKNGNYRAGICFGLLDQVVDNSQGQGSKYAVSTYDYTYWELVGKPRDYPHGHTDVEAYLGGHGQISSNYLDVLEAIHSTPSHEAGQSYRECTDPPYNALKHQDGLGVTQDVVELLNSGVKMLFFNGVHDLICNHVGNEIAVENFQWKHRDEYLQAKRYGWRSPSTNDLAGYMKKYENLMYLKVLNCGHMVPMSAPDVALDLIRGLIYDIPFSSYEQQLGRTIDTPGENCPTCPSCPAEGTNKVDDVQTEELVCDEGLDATVATKVFFLGSMGTAFLFGCVYCLFCICSGKKDNTAEVSKYDLELSGASYTDRPDEYGEVS